jgi:hypothetical protein
MIMENHPVPELSVILVTSSRYGTIKRAVDNLQAQTAASRIEVVIVAPDCSKLEFRESAVQSFAGFQVIEVEPEMSQDHSAQALGIRRARAPLVAFSEDHSFPNSVWAQALIEAHAQGFEVVGPVVGNANPGSTVSWAGFLISYGRWMVPEPGGLIDHLPGNNSSYRRDILLAYGSELDELLEAQSVLHWKLAAAGHRLRQEPRAITSHLNFSLLSPWLMEQLYSGRVFAATRSFNRSVKWRLVYSLGSPLIPLVRLVRVLCYARKARLTSQLMLRTLPALILGLMANGMGEMLGYAFGAGDAKAKRAALEYGRERFLNRSDRLSFGYM